MFFRKNCDFRWTTVPTGRNWRVPWAHRSEKAHPQSQSIPKDKFWASFLKNFCRFRKLDTKLGRSFFRSLDVWVSALIWKVSGVSWDFWGFEKMRSVVVKWQNPFLMKFSAGFGLYMGPTLHFDIFHKLNIRVNRNSKEEVQRFKS